MPLLPNTVKWRDFSGGDITNVSSDIVVKNSVPFSMNLLFDKEIGLALSRLGTSIVGNQLVSSKSCIGLYQHIDSTAANNKLFAGFSDGKVYDVIAGTASLTGLSTSNRMRFATFINSTLMLNGGSAKSYTAAGGWISTGGVFDLANIPTNAANPIEYKDRVYCTVTDQLYFTSTPSAGAVSWTAAGSGSIQIEREDGGGTIQGLGKVPGYLMILKQHSLKRWDANSTFPEDLINIGTSSAESIVYGQSTLFFFYGPKGFYATKGGYPLRISRPIQRIIDAISPTFYSKVNGWCDNEHVYWSIGNITVDFGTGYTESHNNVVVRYTLESQEWAVLKYAHQSQAMTKYVSGNSILLINGDDNGQVLQLNSGYSDYGGIGISYILQSGEIDFGFRERMKSVMQKIIVHSYNSDSAILQVRKNCTGRWDNVGVVKGLVSEVQVQKPLSANVFEFRIINTITGHPARLRGLDFPKVDVLASTT